MRLVQQIAQMLASLIALRQQGRYAEAAEEIDALCLQTMGLSVERLRRLSPETLAAHLEAGGALRHHRAITLAELLVQDAELSVLAERPADALLSRLNAFCLLADAVRFLPAAEHADYGPKIAALSAQLASAATHPYVAEKLREYTARLSG